MNSVDRALNQMISTPHFIRQNLKTILERTEQAYQTIVLKGQQKYGEKAVLDEEQRKELLAKCMLETVNRFLF